MPSGSSTDLVMAAVDKITHTRMFFLMILITAHNMCLSKITHTNIHLTIGDSPILLFNLQSFKAWQVKQSLYYLQWNEAIPSVLTYDRIEKID